MFRLPSLAGQLAIGLAALSCAGSSTDPAQGSDSCLATLPATESAAPAGSTYLAFAQSFRGYHDWPSYDVTEDADLVGIHDGSVVTEYINRLPPSGSLEFPIGTLVVKEATGGTIEHEIFAMAKRGGGFNTTATGWEWFELENLDCADDRVKLIWRGVGPPIGETYGGDPNGGCNSCHAECGNDAVCAKALQLDTF
jgi:hypothetical protein